MHLLFLSHGSMQKQPNTGIKMRLLDERESRGTRHFPGRIMKPLLPISAKIGSRKDKRQHHSSNKRDRRNRLNHSHLGVNLFLRHTNNSLNCSVRTLRIPPAAPNLLQAGSRVSPLVRNNSPNARSTHVPIPAMVPLPLLRNNTVTLPTVRIMSLNNTGPMPEIPLTVPSSHTAQVNLRYRRITRQILVMDTLRPCDRRQEVHVLCHRKVLDSLNRDINGIVSKLRMFSERDQRRFRRWGFRTLRRRSAGLCRLLRHGSFERWLV